MTLQPLLVHPSAAAAAAAAAATGLLQLLGACSSIQRCQLLLHFQDDQRTVSGLLSNVTQHLTQGNPGTNIALAAEVEVSAAAQLLLLLLLLVSQSSSSSSSSSSASSSSPCSCSCRSSRRHRHSAVVVAIGAVAAVCAWLPSLLLLPSGLQRGGRRRSGTLPRSPRLSRASQRSTTAWPRGQRLKTTSTAS